MRLTALLLVLLAAACAGPPSNTPDPAPIFYNGPPTGADTGSDF